MGNYITIQGFFAMPAKQNDVDGYNITSPITGEEYWSELNKFNSSCVPLEEDGMVVFDDIPKTLVILTVIKNANDKDDIKTKLSEHVDKFFENKNNL